MAAVWKLKQKPGLKFVLLALADHADHEGNGIYPAVDTIAQKTGYSRREVQRAQRELQRAGLLIPDGTGIKGTNRWRIPIGEGGDILTPCQDGTGDKQNAGGMKESHPGGDKHDAQLGDGRSPKPEPSSESHPTNHAAVVVASKFPPPRARAAVPISKSGALFLEKIGRLSKKEAELLSEAEAYFGGDELEKIIHRATTKDHPRAWFFRAIEAKHSDRTSDPKETTPADAWKQHVTARSHREEADVQATLNRFRRPERQGLIASEQLLASDQRAQPEHRSSGAASEQDPDRIP